MSGQIPNTISNQDDSDEEEKDENLNGNPNVRSFTDRFDKTKKVFTNDLKQFIKSKEDLFAFLKWKGSFIFPHSMNARWNSCAILYAGKRSCSRIAKSERSVFLGIKNSMRALSMSRL